MPRTLCSRRTYLRWMAGGLGALVTRHGWAGEPLPVRFPRATDGDDVSEPDWDDRLTVTVGNDHGDLAGDGDEVLQAALDYVARWGGGTVQCLPGTFTLRNAVFLPSHTRLRGSGAETVITKIASESQPLIADSDWYDQEITVAQPGVFRVGDGVVLRAKNVDHGGSVVIKRTIVASSGRRLKLNDGLRENLWLSGDPTCSSLFPLLTSENTTDVSIENLVLDGNGSQNENFDGNYGGCIFLQDCNRYTIRNVEARHYNGDGISFQICHDVLVENCYSHDNTGLGVHPGSGSQRPVLRHNRLSENSQGIFWCWGVKYGLAEGNRLDGNRDYGISIGHNDTDNIIRDNDITNSGKVGIFFRDDPRGEDFWPNRNVIENNRITNSGDANGVAIDLTGRVRDIKLAGNRLRERRGEMQRTGIRIGRDVGTVHLTENTIEGFAQPMLDLR